ncbi:cysteine desulfurase-like protein [Nocardioides dongxiaopingii]|uniref:cysteine desulfurase-like protein n=1 Tax=Nocardioides sp. S-1144 TaxID=2582905 RepID=UPI001162C1AC|nr:cysteine desulfurase-like protein [Nocardioides sp. S-1144]QDH10603.1 cysteine desulfurase-like protein [Nocardioides sp. S-1144]
MTTYDVVQVRSAFPALADGLARFDGPGGSLVPRQVADAIATAMSWGMCQRGSLTEPERRAEETTVGARAAMAAHVGADPRGVVFGRSMTALTFDLARTLAQGWGPGDEVVVTRLDHDGDIRPWVTAAERVGATVRWLGFDPVTAELDDVATVLTERTRLVAVTGASNLFGTRPPVRAVAEAAHAAGALVHVDAVHLAAHAPVDLTALGADFLTCSPYKFFGPHLGVLAADPALLETLQPDKLLPSSDAVPERFELGTLPYELLAGVSAAVAFIDSVGGMAAIEAHEDGVLARLLDALAALPHVRVHGSPARRTPTLLLHVDGRTGDEVRVHLAGQGIVAPNGSFYALEASRHAGLGDDGGVRVGLAPYTTDGEVDRLVTALAALA